MNTKNTKRFVRIGLILTLTASRAAAVVLTVETSAKVQFQSESGKSYQVYGSTNLDHSSWFALGDAQAGSGGTITFFYNTKEDQKVFFKVEENNGIVVPAIPAFLSARARLNLDGQNLSRATLTNLDLNYFSFFRANLSGADLRNANLTEADFEAANLTAANLGNANLTGASLSDADLTNASLNGADLTGASLNGADLTNADLTNADLSGAKGFTELSGMIFNNTTMPDGTIRTDGPGNPLGNAPATLAGHSYNIITGSGNGQISFTSASEMNLREPGSGETRFGTYVITRAGQNYSGTVTLRTNGSTGPLALNFDVSVGSGHFSLALAEEPLLSGTFHE